MFHSVLNTPIYFAIYQKQSLADVFQNMCNIHRKRPVLKSLFDNVAGPQVYNFVKKRLRYRCFPVNFVNIIRTTFFTEQLGSLL